MTLDEARQRATLRVTEAASLLGISSRAAYAAIGAGEIPALHIGRRIVVPAPRLLALLGDEQSAACGEGLHVVQPPGTRTGTGP